jgi:hypothetical protein
MSFDVKTEPGGDLSYFMSNINSFDLKAEQEYTRNYTYE